MMACADVIHSILVWIQIKGRIQEFFITFINIVRFSMFLFIYLLHYYWILMIIIFTPQQKSWCQIWLSLIWGACWALVGELPHLYLERQLS